MTKRESDAVAKILTDPENISRSAEEVAELVIEALTDYVKQIRADEVDRIARQVVESIEGERVGGIPARVADAIDDMRSVTHRLAVVGQIKYGPQGPTHTVILGPFSSRGVLDTPEKFDKAVAGASSARGVGQQLAWDTKSGKGRGRFMLAPAFLKPRDAWDFHRPAGHGEELKQLTTKMLIEGGWRQARGYAELKADLEAWVAGRWAQENPVEPGCVCGLAERYTTGQRGYTRHGVPTGRCHRHEEER